MEQADLFGYSMGGAAAVQVAKRHPALARKVVFAGAAGYHPDGLYPEVLGFEKVMKPENFAGLHGKSTAFGNLKPV